MSLWNISGAGTTTDLLLVMERLRVAQEALRTRDAQLLSVQKELVAARRRATDLFYRAPAAHLTCTREGTILTVNSAAAALLGVEADSLLGESFGRLFATNGEEWLSHLNRCEDTDAYSTDVMLQKRTGESFTVRMSMTIWEPDEATPEVYVTLSELAVSVPLANDALVEAKRIDRRKEPVPGRDRLRKSASTNGGGDAADFNIRVAEVCEREKRRIGQDLHDETCQSLAGLAMQAGALSTQLQRENASLRNEMEQLAIDLQALVKTTRQIAHGFHPASLREGLLPALRELTLAASKKIPCVLEVDSDFDLPRNSELVCFRIAQEGIANAVNHSQASNILVGLRHAPSHYVLTVKDNGRGLPATNGTPHGMGLDIIGCRAQSVGAQLVVENCAEGGVQLTCYFPRQSPVEIKAAASIGRSAAALALESSPPQGARPYPS